MIQSLTFATFESCSFLFIGRYLSHLEQAQALKTNAEKASANSQHELNAALSKLSFIEAEHTRLKKEIELDRAGWERERNRLIAESEHTINALRDEKDAAILQAHQDMKRKVAEMNEKMTRSLATLQENDRESLRQEIEGNHYRSITEIQKKCQKEIEAVRSEERRLAAVEIENVRSAFSSREHQTAEDLIQLEKLHAIRVAQLEKQLAAVKAQQQATEEKLMVASQAAVKGNASAQRHAEDLQQTVQESAKHAEQLKQDLLRAHQELQECHAREASYREQLNQALTENRLQRAELLELKEQAASGSAQAYQWKKATKESELSIIAAEQAVRIARDEVSMLEHALRRKEDELTALRRDLLRADRLIYGVPQHEPPDETNRTYQVQLQPSCLFEKTPIITDVPTVNADFTNGAVAGIASFTYPTPQRANKATKATRRSPDMSVRRVLQPKKSDSAVATGHSVNNRLSNQTLQQSSPMRARTPNRVVKMVPKHTISSAQKLRNKQETALL